MNTCLSAYFYYHLTWKVYTSMDMLAEGNRVLPLCFHCLSYTVYTILRPRSLKRRTPWYLSSCQAARPPLSQTSNAPLFHSKPHQCSSLFPYRMHSYWSRYRPMTALASQTNTLLSQLTLAHHPSDPNKHQSTPVTNSVCLFNRPISRPAPPNVPGVLLVPSVHTLHVIS